MLFTRPKPLEPIVDTPDGEGQPGQRAPMTDMQRMLREQIVTTRLLETVMTRLIRIETRLVVLMREHGLNPDGSPLDH